jgi:hypothetical protein
VNVPGTLAVAPSVSAERRAVDDVGGGQVMTGVRGDCTARYFLRTVESTIGPESDQASAVDRKWGPTGEPVPDAPRKFSTIGRSLAAI